MKSRVAVALLFLWMLTTVFLRCFPGTSWISAGLFSVLFNLFLLFGCFLLWWFCHYDGE